MEAKHCMNELKNQAFDQGNGSVIIVPTTKKKIEPKKRPPPRSPTWAGVVGDHSFANGIRNQAFKYGRKNKIVGTTTSVTHTRLSNGM